MSLRKKVINSLLVLFFVFLIFIAVSAVVVPYITFRNMDDFYALWETTDAIMHYLGEHRKWPESFDSLEDSFLAMNVDRDRVDNLRERVDIEFQVDVDQEPQSDDWYVQLKSGRMGPEEEKANRRLRNSVRNLRSKRGFQLSQ